MAQDISIKERLKGFVKQGTSPKELAASSTIGLLLGIFPVFGVTTLMMAAISVRWRLNLALMLALSYLSYPLQLLLLIPFVRAGERLTGTRPISFAPSDLGKAFEANALHVLADLGTANLLAVLGWAVWSIPVGSLLFLGLRQILKTAILRSKAN